MLDVREPIEYAQAHVPGAVPIPMGQLPARMGELDKAATVLVICATDNRSSAMTLVIWMRHHSQHRRPTRQHRPLTGYPCHLDRHLVVLTAQFALKDTPLERASPCTNDTPWGINNQWSKVPIGVIHNLPATAQAKLRPVYRSQHPRSPPTAARPGHGAALEASAPVPRAGAAGCARSGLTGGVGMRRSELMGRSDPAAAGHMRLAPHAAMLLGLTARSRRRGGRC